MKRLLAATMLLCAMCTGRNETTPYTVNTMGSTMYMPASGTTVRAVVVALHHGGWHGGHRLDIDAQCRALCSSGIAVLNIDYTLSKGDTKPAICAVHDEIDAALSRAKSLLCARGVPVCLCGFSAGGHLAATYCNRRGNLPDGLIVVSGPVDLRIADYFGHETMVCLLGEHDDWDRALKEYSPLYNPPNPAVAQLSIWGGRDVVLDWMSREDYMTVLGRMPIGGGVLLPGAEHAMEGQIEQWASIVVAWISGIRKG